VLLKTSDGDPLAVWSSVGEGTLVQFAISGNDAWTNLPLRPIFLPLIQQLVLDLAGRQDSYSVEVGEPIVVDSRDWPRPTVESVVRETFGVRTPLDEFELDSPPDGEPLRYTATYVPGPYRIQKRVRSASGETEQFETLRVASVSPTESMLVDVEESRLEAVAGLLDATVYTDVASLRSADRTRAYGREIWRWLLVALLVALVAELWVQQNLLAGRTTAANSSPASSGGSAA
jgi:hypothetical protein